MKNVFIFGSNGMLGRYVYSYFKENSLYNIIPITRTDIDILKTNKDSIKNILMGKGLQKDDVIINCAGLIKQRNDIKSSEYMLVNSVFPHYLDEISNDIEANFTHITTDCFLPNTKVYLEKEIKNIENIKISDKVYTHTGELKKVYKLKNKIIDENIFNIKGLMKNNFKCTSNHPFLVIKRNKREKPNFNKKEWVLAKDLNKYDLLTIPKLKIPITTKLNIDLLEYSNEYKKTFEEYLFYEKNIKNKKINIKNICYKNNLKYKKILNWNKNKKPKICKLINNILIDIEFMWFLGLFLADGWVDNSKNRKSIHLTIENNTILINKTINIIKKVFNINPNIRYIKNQKSCEIYFTNQLLSEMLSIDFYNSDKHYSYTKKIPNWVRNIGKNNIMSFINGYLDGDGCFFNKLSFLTLSSVSEQLIDELEILFNYIDILPSRTLCKKTNIILNRQVNNKLSHKLTISGKQINKIKNYFELDILNNNFNKYQKFFEDDNYWYIPIKNISNEKYKGFVYNLEVEDDNSYLINGGISAHNCVFNGDKGFYNENDKHDAYDMYGKSKSFGEPSTSTVIRTSIIGDELYNKKSLIEWVKSNKDKEVFGYTNHTWNGITCLQLSKFLKLIVETDLYWNGVRHIFSPNNVTKFELVQMISDVYNLNIKVNPKITDDNCYRTLSSIYDIHELIIDNLLLQLKEQKDYYSILIKY